MPGRSRKYLETALFLFYALFLFSSTFSIALAQITLGLSLALFLILAVVMRYNPLLSPMRRFYLFVGLYVFWMLLSAAVGPSPLRSMFIIKEEWLFGAVAIGILLMGRTEYRYKLLATFAAGVMMVSIYGIIQHLTGIHWLKATPLAPAPDYGYLVRGNFPHPLTFGNYYATAAVFLAGLALGGRRELTARVRLLFVSSSLLGMVATVLSYSRGAIAGMVVGLVLLGLLIGRKYLLYMLGIISVAAVAVLIVRPGLTARFSGKIETDFGGAYEGGRVFIWKNTLRVIQEHPLLGVGQGNFRAAYCSHLRPDISERRKHVHAHNDFLNVAAISGLPGALFFSGIWWATISYFRKSWKARSREGPQGSLALAALVGSVTFLVTSLFEATFADEEVRQMLMFIWAAGLCPSYNRSKQEPASTVESA